MFQNTDSQSSETRFTLHAPVRAAHPEQGWSLLVNGVVLFDDGGALLPGGGVVAPGGLVLAA